MSNSGLWIEAESMSVEKISEESTNIITSTKVQEPVNTPNPNKTMSGTEMKEVEVQGTAIVDQHIAPYWTKRGGLQKLDRKWPGISYERFFARTPLTIQNRRNIIQHSMQQKQHY
jgi:hypothetical protein